MASKGTALVTGAGVRLGRELALALADDGYAIALHFNRSARPAAETAECIREKGLECELFEDDLSQADKLSALMARVFDWRADCRLLINSASIFERASLRDTPDDLLDRAWAVNLRAPMILTRDFARRAAPGSSVINIIDTKAARTVTGYFAYTMMKKGLLAFTQMAAKELGPAGIRVNGIGPGLTLPPPGEDEAYLERLAKNVPLRRPGAPADIVAAMRFILAADYLTGQCLMMDGGEHLI